MMNTMVNFEQRNALTELQLRLSAAPFDVSRIQVWLKDDVLRLTGVVPNKAAKRDAKALLRSIEGISDIENNLQIVEHKAIPSLQSTILSGDPPWWPTVVRLRSKIH